MALGSILLRHESHPEEHPLGAPEISLKGEFRERMRTLRLGQLLRSLIPRRYDMYLYQGTRETLANTPAPATSLPVTIEHYGPGERTGCPEIDCCLVSTREVYVARVDGAVAHRCALTFAFAERAAQFGFPPGPFVIEGVTMPQFRAKGLQAVMRRYILEEILKRGWKCLYGEIKPDNAASMKGNARGGLRRIARLRAIKFAGMSLRRRVLPPD